MDWGYGGQIDVERTNLFCQCHRNSIVIKFVCPIQNKPARKGSTMWLSFIIWILILLNESENSDIDLTLHSFSCSSSDTQIKNCELKVPQTIKMVQQRYSRSK